MSEPKFTPGPWRVCRSNEDFDGPFYALDDDDYERPINAIRSKSETVACAHDLFEFDEANANLIAAAPELYEACEIFAEWLRREEAGFDHKTHDRNTPEGEAAWREWFYGNLEICGEAQDKARAALAKARGEG